ERVVRWVLDSLTGPAREDLAYLGQAAALVQTHDPVAATACQEAIAQARPTDVVATLRAARGRDERGDRQGAVALLDRALAAGVVDPRLVVERALFAERLSDLAERDRRLEQLVTCANAPPVATQAVIAPLTRPRRFGEAARRVDHALAADPKDGGLWLERARLALFAADAAMARTALQRCLAQKIAPTLRADAERLLRFA